MKIFKDIPYIATGISTEDGKKIVNGNQMLDIYLPDSADEFKVFVYFHGGGIAGGDKAVNEVFAKELCDNGIALISANYRMYPGARYPEFLMDSAAAVAWVAKNIESYGKCKGIYVGGSSAGGYISMMLCFDRRWLAPHDLAENTIAGYIHDAGQPTSHFNVLREKGFTDYRQKVIVDETAPMFHVGEDKSYPDMLFIVSDNDMQNRYEQTILMLSTLKHYGYTTKSRIEMVLMNGTHCSYCDRVDEDGHSAFAKIVVPFINC